MVAVMALAVGACSLPADYTFINRTDDRIALLPGLILGPCADRGYGRAEVVDAATRWLATHGDQSWIPADAVEYQMSMFAMPLPDGPPVVIVIASTGSQTYRSGVPSGAIGPC